MKLSPTDRTLANQPKVPESFLSILNFKEKNILKAHDLCEGVRYPIIGVHETLPQKDTGKKFNYLEIQNPDDDSENLYVWAPARAQKALSFAKGEMFLKLCDYVFSGISPNGYAKVTILERITPNTATKTVKRKRKAVPESDAPVLASTSCSLSIENMITDAMAVSGLDEETLS